MVISRVRKLGQLHLWALHKQAFKSSPEIEAEYDILRTKLLTADVVENAQARGALSPPMPATMGTGFVRTCHTCTQPVPLVWDEALRVTVRAPR